MIDALDFPEGDNPGILVSNQMLVEELQRAISNAPRNLKSLRGSLRDVLERGAWMDRLDPHRGTRFRYDSADKFLAFIRDQLPEGLDTDPDTIRRFLTDDLETLSLFDAALQRGPGNPTGANQYTPEEDGQAGTFDNVQDSSPPPAPTGTSRVRSLRKLRQAAEDADASPAVQDIYRRVLAEEISPHRGMIEAGFRKVPTPLEKARRAVARLSDADAAALVAWVQAGRPGEGREG